MQLDHETILSGKFQNRLCILTIVFSNGYLLSTAGQSHMKPKLTIRIRLVSMLKVSGYM